MILPSSFPRLFAAVAVAALIAPASAKIQTQAIPYRDGDTALQGYLVYDDAVTGPRPGVLICHEWWGLTDYIRSRAQQIAQLGYVAFALDMYGHGKVTGHPDQAQTWSSDLYNRALVRSRAKLGLDVLANHPLVDRSRLAAMGYCMGGNVALELAYSGADLRGVAAFHSSLPPPSLEHTPPIKAKIFIGHGADDPLLLPERVSKFIEAMRNSGVDWQMISYGRAMHGFTNPAADQYGVHGVAYNADADRRSWQHLKLFLAEIFSEKTVGQ